jgi:hypothetical protein
MWPGRGLCAGRCAERLHGDALVTHVEDLELLGGTRRVKDYTVPWPRPHQCARQRRLPTDMVAIQIDLVGADDAHHPLGAGGVRVPNSRTEEHVARGAPISRGLWIDHLRRVDTFREKANASIDLTQPPFVVLVVGVLTAITVARCPSNHLRHSWPFFGEQEPQLISQPLESARRNVVLDSWVRFLRDRHADDNRNPPAANRRSRARSLAQPAIWIGNHKRRCVYGWTGRPPTSAR